MERIERSRVTCLFCGKTRIVTTIADDGIDFYGHARGSSSVSKEDDGCSCTLGQIEKKKANIKAMCLNCKFYRSGCCTNKKEIDAISEFFDCGEKLVVKTPEKKCEHHKLDTSIFLKLLK